MKTSLANQLYLFLLAPKREKLDKSGRYSLAEETFPLLENSRISISHSELATICLLVYVYRIPPGHDPLERVQHSDVGEMGLQPVTSRESAMHFAWP